MVIGSIIGGNPIICSLPIIAGIGSAGLFGLHMQRCFVLQLVLMWKQKEKTIREYYRRTYREPLLAHQQGLEANPNLRAPVPLTMDERELRVLEEGNSNYYAESGMTDVEDILF
jgi:hypothetical protein